MDNIRIAQLKDVSIMSSVLAASWKSAYRGIVGDKYLDSLECDHWVDFLTSGLNDNSIFAMAMENAGQMIGTAILSKTEKEREACLISFYLLPDKIGQGFGHAFYVRIENELTNMGFSNIFLDVLENNKRAIRFYKAHGYIDTSREIKTALGEREYVCKVFEKALC